MGERRTQLVRWLTEHGAASATKPAPPVVSNFEFAKSVRTVVGWSRIQRLSRDPTAGTGLARTSDVRGHRGAVDAVGPWQFAHPPVGLVVGQQPFDLGRGQAPLDAAQLADVRSYFP